MQKTGISLLLVMLLFSGCEGKEAGTAEGGTEGVREARKALLQELETQKAPTLPRSKGSRLEKAGLRTTPDGKIDPYFGRYVPCLLWFQSHRSKLLLLFISYARLFEQIRNLPLIFNG